jgi:hypothetical protein
LVVSRGYAYVSPALAISLKIGQICSKSSLVASRIFGARREAAAIVSAALLCLDAFAFVGMASLPA